MKRLLVLSLIAFVAVAVAGLLAAREVAQSSDTVGTSPLMSSAPSNPLFPPEEQHPTFSIEFTGPSSTIQGGAWHPADILWNPGAPMVCIPCAGLGLAPTGGCVNFPPSFDDLDALTYGADFLAVDSADGYLGFSVDKNSSGQPGTAVSIEASCVPPEPEADEFMTQLDGNNTQYFDGDGIDCVTGMGVPGMGLWEVPQPPPSDNLNALDNKDCWEIDPDQDGLPNRWVYFSLHSGAATLMANMWGGADVLVTQGGMMPARYATAAQLGLVGPPISPEDDVNGLCLADMGMDDIFDPDGTLTGFQDYLFYTVTDTSPSIPAVVPNAATIMYVPFPGVAVPVDTATALGLLEDNTDDVDAMKCVKGLVDISIEDYWITLPDGTDVREGDTGASLTLTVSEWVDLTMTEIKHYWGVEGELSPPSVISNVWWAVLGAPLGSVNVVFEPEPGDICTYDGEIVDCLTGEPVFGDINDLHFQVDLPWCEDVPVVRTVQFHCKEPGQFPIQFENIEMPLGADDINPENNEGLIDLIIICEEPVATPTNTPVPPTPTSTPEPTLGDTHYQCYDILPPAPLGPPFVWLDTQFGGDLVEVGPSMNLCAPAIKNGEGDLLDPHLKCYDISGGDPDVVVNLETQFGVEENVEVGAARLLCMGAAKTVIFPIQIPPTGPPADLYYECFDISATGHVAGVLVVVEDQFSFNPFVIVGHAELLCAPALLEGMGTWDAPHLKCYQKPPFLPGEYWLILETLFGFEFDVQLGASRWLCTEALKEVVECIDRLGDTQCDDPVNDPDDDGCATWEEQAGAPAPKPGATGAYDPNAWYDFYDVPVPAKDDAVDGVGPDAPVGANGTRNRAVTMGDVLAVLTYVGTFAGDGGAPNPNGVAYDTVKGVDLDGDTTDDAPYSHGIKEGVKYDRSPGPLPDPPADAGPPSGAVTMGDVLAVLAQVGLACTG